MLYNKFSELLLKIDKSSISLIVVFNTAYNLCNSALSSKVRLLPLLSLISSYNLPSGSIPEGCSSFCSTIKELIIEKIILSSLYYLIL